MKGVIYYGLIMLWGLLAGCSTEGLPGEEEVETGYPVRFSLPGITPLTRAVAGGETALADGTELTIAAYDPNTQAFVASRPYKVSGSALVLDNTNPDTDEMYLAVGTYTFCAMTPRQGELAENGRKGTIPKQTDALGTVTTGQMKPATTTITLNNLEHLASQIHFTVQVVSQKVPSIHSFAVQSIEVNGMVKESAHNYKLPENELIKPASGDAGGYEFLTIGNAEQFSAGAAGDGSKPGFVNTQKNPIVVFPKEQSSFAALVKVLVQTTEEQAAGTPASEKVLQVKINRLAFEPGKRYLFEVNYGWDYVWFNLKVSDWTTVDNKGEAVGGGEQEVGNTLVVEGWGTIVDLNMDI